MKQTLTIIEVEAALCMWEHIVENHAHQPWHDWLNNHGSGAMRHCAMQGGLIAHEVYTLLQKQGYEYETSFDWEFVPEIARLIEWDKLIADNQYGGDPYLPDLAQLAGQMLLKQPDNFEFTDPKEAWLVKARRHAFDLWAYSELIDDHAERTDAAYRGGSEPDAWAKWLGEHYDLTPA